MKAGNSPDSAYLLLGKERFLKSEFIQDLKKNLFSSDQAQLNCRQFTSGHDNLHEFLDFCQTTAFLVDKRMAVLWEVEALTAAEKERLLNVFESLSKNSVVVFSCEQSNSKKDNFLKVLAEQSKALVFHPPFDRDLPAWLDARSKKKGVRLSRPAMETLTKRVGKDLAYLDASLEQLALFVHPRTEVTPEDVQRLMGRSAQQDVFQLMDLIVAKDTPGSLRCLESLLVEGVHAAEILAVLGGQFERLKKASNLLAVNAPSQQISTELKVHSFYLEKFLKQASQLSSERGHWILTKLLDCDETIKSGAIEQSLAVELLMLELAR